MGVSTRQKRNPKSELPIEQLLLKKCIVHTTPADGLLGRQTRRALLPSAPAEGEPVTCPACLVQHPLIYEDQQSTDRSWGYVECDYEYVLAVVEGRVLADTPLKIDDQ
jgi:hypothetical protein